MLAAALALAGPAQAAPRVMSLDQCADQYMLALSPREAIVGVSPRVDDRDSYLRARAAGLPQRRASAEAVLAARPDVVVRYWGGGARLTRTLERRGVRVVKIEEAEDFGDVGANVRRVASALGQQAAGDIKVADDHVVLTVTLPWLLAKFAHAVQGAVKKQGTLMLEKK